MDEATRKEGLRAFRGTTIRGRDDWTKHFLVSASLTLLGSDNVLLARTADLSFQRRVDLPQDVRIAFLAYIGNEFGTARNKTRRAPRRSCPLKAYDK